MTLRFTLHLLICVLLATFGYWLYTQLNISEYKFINSISVASYWFGFLVFLLFSWLLYWILHRRSLKAWAIAQFISVLIAVISTVALVVISHDHEDRRQADEETFLLKNEFKT